MQYVACRLLKSCLLSDIHFKLVLSTVANMTFEATRYTLKNLFVEYKIIDMASGPVLNTGCIKVEPRFDADASDVLYSKY